MLQDPEIEAVYNPLPNHLHVPLSIAAAEAGKHVLCEKPIALSAAEAHSLVAARERTGVLIQEAFMVRCHPQWMRVRELVRNGAIGTLRVVQGSFSYSIATRPTSATRPISAVAAFYDIGCYPIVGSRFLFAAEPIRVAAPHRARSRFRDRPAGQRGDGFPAGQALFFLLDPARCLSAHADPRHDGRIEIEIPFNAPPDRHADLSR